MKNKKNAHVRFYVLIKKYENIRLKREFLM